VDDVTDGLPRRNHAGPPGHRRKAHGIFQEITFAATVERFGHARRTVVRHWAVVRHQNDESVFRDAEGFQLGHQVADPDVPTDRIIDGIDQTALFLKGDSFSRRDYVFIYTGNVSAATVKGRYKRVWVGEKPGLSGAAFFDLYTDPREENGKMLPMFPAKGMFNIMKTRHQLWMLKYPNTGEGRAFPLTGIENARPETKAAGQPRVDISKLPFDPYQFIKLLPEWNNIEFDEEE
jgi:hypothetical protein